MLAAGLMLGLATMATSGSAVAQVAAQEATLAQLCEAVDAAAAAYRVPSGLLARVLWQESRFRSHVVSPKGAAGLAQFMPKTASARGLADPWNPMLAVREAARYLADLNLELGNLGLATAGYNAGSGRVRQWLQAKSSLPTETQRYVLAVTGRPPEHWATNGAAFLPTDPRPCLRVIAELSHGVPAPLRVALPAITAPAVPVTSRATVGAATPASAPRLSPVFIANARNLCRTIQELGADCRILVP